MSADSYDRTAWCSTGKRKLMMMEIGVEGDRFKPHPVNDACERAGCIVATNDETCLALAQQLAFNVEISGVRTSIRYVADYMLIAASYENLK